MHKCPVCVEPMQEVFQAQVLQRHTAVYDHCPACGFLRIRKPHWYEEAYSSAISSTDTGILVRNVQIARNLAALLPLVAKDGPYLDYAGGYGILTRMMRDRGFDFYWSDRYCDNLLATGFDYDPQQTGPCQAATAFEVLEHVEDPVELVQEVLQAGAETFIFTTELYSGNPPQPGQWWYYAPESGQHISFYRHDTLATLGRRLNLHFHSRRGMHILSRNPLPKSRINLVLSPLTPVFARLVRRPGLSWSDHQLNVARLQS